MSNPDGPRQLGDYFKSGDWSDYWSTSVSQATDSKLLIRGYPIEEIIDQLSYSEVLFLAVRGDLPTKPQARVLDAALCSIPANQWIAAHLLAAAATASASPESPIPGIASGILTMGSVTVSPQATAELIYRAQELLAETGSMDEAAIKVVEEYRAEGKRIPGLGHPTRKDHDPRATALAEVTKREGVWGEICELYSKVHQTMLEQTGKQLPINIDGMLACVLAELGFNPREMGGVAAVAAMPGIVAYVIEEIERGVPLRIVPDALGSKYTGPAERHIESDGGAA
ncbi:MAG TPA: citryl-CoA lyase [Solirubrobacterales bacterium]|jgi:citrate synthase